VELRDAAMPSDGQPVRPASPAGPAGAPTVVVGPVRYRVDPRFAAVKVAGVVILGLVALAFRGDAIRTAFAVLAALVVAGYAVRDLVAPVRLAADRDGVTLVSGYAGRRRLAWADIERVRVDRHSRYGLRSEFLEIDAGESIHLFSSYDLGTHPESVVETLDALRQAD
jgi:hypothetical protein